MDDQISSSVQLWVWCRAHVDLQELKEQTNGFLSRVARVRGNHDGFTVSITSDRAAVGYLAVVTYWHSEEID